MPRVISHTARLAPREFYSVARSDFRDGLRRCAIHGGKEGNQRLIIADCPNLECARWETR